MNGSPSAEPRLARAPNTVSSWRRCAGGLLPDWGSLNINQLSDEVVTILAVVHGRQEFPGPF